MPRTLFIDMPAGVAGDMLLAALVDAGGDAAALEAVLGTLGIGPIGLRTERVQTGGLASTQVTVQADQRALWGQPRRSAVLTAPDHDHRPYRVIRDLLARAPLEERVRARASAAFRFLAEAEAEVHGTDPDAIEFHEVGGVDAIADIVGVCWLLERLGIDRVVASPLLPGHGTVTCAHGRMPVPVPAVARMLGRVLPRSGVRPPWNSLSWESGELTTPTGAALVCSLADAWGERHTGLTLVANGTGAGHKTIPGLVNVVRVLIADRPATPTSTTIVELACQMDDTTGEDLALVVNDLLTEGALEAYLTPIVMKKGRPGHLLNVHVRPDDETRLTHRLLTRTTTLGIRRSTWERTELPREVVTVQVGGHPLRLKVVRRPDGRTTAKPEAADVEAAAVALGWPWSAVRDAALTAWRVAPPSTPGGASA